MRLFILLAALLAASGVVFVWGRRRALASVDGNLRRLHSLPGYYGAYAVAWSLVPATLLILAWVALEPVVLEWLMVRSLPPELDKFPDHLLGLVINDIINLATGKIATREPGPAVMAAAEYYRGLLATSAVLMTVLAVGVFAGGVVMARRRIRAQLRAIYKVEGVVQAMLLIASTIAVLTTLGIVLSLVFETMRFFARVPPSEFFLGTQWSPQTALRAGQVGSSGAFGAIPVFTGTLVVSAVAMLVAAPVGLFSAIYMAEYASPRVRGALKPVLEILAGIPTVVYGFFAALTVAPVIREVGESLGLDVASESALAAGSVMGVMIIPFVSSLSDDVINAVPDRLREASDAMGATRSETIKGVVLPAALPGIVGGLLLAISRAIGETMIVVMAAGLAANLTANPVDSVTTVTVQIVTLLVGDQEFESAKTLSAFALGLTLFAVTLAFNVIALLLVRRYREQYE